MADRSCRSCGAGGMSDLGPCAAFPEPVIRDLESRLTGADPGRLYFCESCGLGQRQPCLGGEALAEVYRNNPADLMDYNFEDNCAWTVALGELRGRYSTSDAVKVLDVGCHTGLFLRALPDAWQRFGIESAVEPVRAAMDGCGVTIIAEWIECVDPVWDGQFDAVTMFDVIEHLPDPQAALSRVAALVKPGGCLLVSTGLIDAWTWKLSRGRHWYLQSPQHLSVVSTRFLSRSAKVAGLRLQRTERIAHRRSRGIERLREAASCLHWEARSRGGWYRLPQRLLQSIPGLRELRHRRSVPWTMSLKDHVLAVFDRSSQPTSRFEEGLK